jgi:hypothetical protein
LNVKKKNRHIDKYFHDKLPDPEVPADDAWMQMNDMLNAVPGGNTYAGKAGNWAAKLMKFKAAISIGFIAVAVSVFVVYKTLNPVADISSKSTLPKQFTNPIKPSDSLQYIENLTDSSHDADKKTPSISVEAPIESPLDLASAPVKEKSGSTLLPIEKRNITRHVIASESHENRVTILTNKPKRKENKLNSNHEDANQNIPVLFPKSVKTGDLANNSILPNKKTGQVNPVLDQVATQL